MSDTEVKQTGAQGTVLRKSFDPDNNLINVNALNSFVPARYDEIDITYISGGNGDGEIGTVSWLLDNETISTISLTYDSSNRLINIVKVV